NPASAPNRTRKCGTDQTAAYQRALMAEITGKLRNTSFYSERGNECRSQSIAKYLIESRRRSPKQGASTCSPGQRGGIPERASRLTRYECCRCFAIAGQPHASAAWLVISRRRRKSPARPKSTAYPTMRRGNLPFSAPHCCSAARKIGPNWRQLVC